MAVAIAHYRGIVSDNYQGGSGKPYEDKVVFSVDEDSCIYTIFGLADMEIKAKTQKLSELTMCNNDKNYQLIRIEISE